MTADCNENQMARWLWLTWERHRRTRELSQEFSLRLFEKVVELPRLVRYPYLMVWSAKVLISQRPQGVIVQCPSLVLALWVLALSRILHFRVVIDAHNEVLRPFGRRPSWMLFLYRLIQARANLVIVTNKHLADLVKQNGGTPLVLEDKLPSFNGHEVEVAETLKGKLNITCIATFDKDEPVTEVIEAARRLPLEWCLYITGNSRKLSSAHRRGLTPNIILTGFLPEKDYVALLKASDVIMDLTLLDDCLVCGAYEAVALEKPMILSNTRSIRHYFYKGAIYTANSSDEIQRSIEQAVLNLEQLRTEIRELRVELSDEWSSKKDQLLRPLAQLIDKEGGTSRKVLP